MQFLIENGAQIDRPMFENGRTMLMDAALRGNQRMLEFLLKHGASKDERCSTGKTLTDYIKTDSVGKSQHAKSEMNRLVYKDLLLRVAIGD